MTIDDRYVLDLADLATLRLECGACGAVQTNQARQPPQVCPACGVRWFPDAPSESAVRQLLHAMRDLAALSDRGGVRIRFELPRPKV